MSDGFSKRRRKRRSVATSARGVPASVIAMNCLPGSATPEAITASQK